MSRLTIDLTEQQHQALKAMAALQGKTIKQYTVERLFPAATAAKSAPTATPEEQALQELKALLNARLAEVDQAGVVERSASDIAGDVLGDRGLT
jgi:hypothetical protein